MANFADALSDATYATTTSTMDAAIPDKWWSKKFLPLLTQGLVLHQFAQLQPLPEGNGKVIEFSRPRPLAAAMTALTEGQNPNASEVLWQKVYATLEEYGDFAQITSFLSQQHLNQKLIGAIPILADQAKQTMNQLLLREIISQGSYHLPGDLSATSQYDGALGTVTSTTVISGGSALEANTNYGDADDDLIGSVITITSGVCEGESRTISDYDADGASTGTAISGRMTVSPAFDGTPEALDTFHVATADEITTGDDLSWANVKKARAILQTRLAAPFADGYYVMVVGPEQAAGLMDDTHWVNTQYYKDQAKGTLTGELGKFCGYRIFEHTTPFNFPITTRGSFTTSYGPGAHGANYSATAAVSAVPCFGKNAFAATSFKKKGNQVMRPPVIVKRPNQYNTNDPLNRFAVAGWVIEAVMKSLRGDHVVSILVDSTQ